MERLKDNRESNDKKREESGENEQEEEEEEKKDLGDQGEEEAIVALSDKDIVADKENIDMRTNSCKSTVLCSMERLNPIPGQPQHESKPPSLSNQGTEYILHIV